MALAALRAYILALQMFELPGRGSVKASNDVVVAFHDLHALICCAHDQSALRKRGNLRNMVKIDRKLLIVADRCHFHPHSWAFQESSFSNLINARTYVANASSQHITRIYMCAASNGSQQARACLEAMLNDEYARRPFARLADGVGFEPTVRSHARRFSRPVP